MPETNFVLTELDESKLSRLKAAIRQGLDHFAKQGGDPSQVLKIDVDFDHPDGIKFNLVH